MTRFKELCKKLYRPKNRADYLIYTLVIAAGIFLDQLTKWLSVKFLMPVNTVPLIKDVLHLTYVENTGAAFGMLKDHRWVFIVISIIAIIVFLAYLYLGHTDSTLSGISLAMIISGGIGNMIDRLAFGYVVDFIDFRLINFAVFNGADSFVCVGAGLLILSLILEMIKESKADKVKNEGNTAEKKK